VRTLQVGDEVWCAVHEPSRQVKLPCPVCFGKLQVTLVLGNDDEIVLPCNYCSKGYSDPVGFTVEYEDVTSAVQIRVTSVTTTQTLTGTSYEYRAYRQGWESGWTLDPENIFETEAEAVARAQQIADAYEQEQDRRRGGLKKSAHASFSWNAGYHTKRAKAAREEAERHERLATLCKARAREPKATQPIQ